MAELTPYPFGALAARMFRELERQQADLRPAGEALLPRRPALRLLGRRATAAGWPHRSGRPPGRTRRWRRTSCSSWLGGARVFELKTVQVLDELRSRAPASTCARSASTPSGRRSCKLEESLEEYVKGAMLIEMLARERPAARSPRGFAAPPVFDLSLGYDLAGHPQRPGAGLRARPDATRGRRSSGCAREIPAELAASATSDFPTALVRHGHAQHLPRLPARGDRAASSSYLHARARDPLRGQAQPDAARRRPRCGGCCTTSSATATSACPTALRARHRLGAARSTWWSGSATTAAGLGLGFGVKLTNTLIVENTRRFLPASEREVYLSGPPLHVLAMHLVRRSARRFGGPLPDLLLGGHRPRNFADAVGAGSGAGHRLHRPAQAGRLRAAAGYYAQLAAAHGRGRGADVDEFVLRAYGEGRAALDSAACRGLDGVRGLRRARPAATSPQPPVRAPRALARGGAPPQRRALRRARHRRPALPPRAQRRSRRRRSAGTSSSSTASAATCACRSARTTPTSPTAPGRRRSRSCAWCGQGEGWRVRERRPLRARRAPPDRQLRRLLQRLRQLRRLLPRGRRAVPDQAALLRQRGGVPRRRARRLPPRPGWAGSSACSAVSAAASSPWRWRRAASLSRGEGFRLALRPCRPGGDGRGRSRRRSPRPARSTLTHAFLDGLPAPGAVRRAARQLRQLRLAEVDP